MLVDLALGTGLRVSEMAALMVPDIDFRRSALTVVRRKKRRVNGGEAETVSTSETLAVDRALRDHLVDYLDGRTEGPLFIGKRGPMTRRGLQQAWKQAIRRAGLPQGLSIHCARHTMATALLRKTGNLRHVQKQLGHASPVTTANLYADVSFEDMQDGVTGLYDGASLAEKR